jgi:light-regulated signal transduction histidine kinase (bacteriophytochrome)
MTSSLIPHIQFFESFTEAVVITEDDGTVVLINPAFKALTGINQESIAQELVSKLKNVEKAKPRETIVTLNDNSTILLRFSSSDIKLGNKRNGKVYTFFENAALRKALDKWGEQSKEIARLNEEFEQFAYAASHDMQEPLRMIASYVQLVQRDIESGETSNVKEFMSYVFDGVVRIQTLINDMLIVSRVSRKGNDFAVADLNETLKVALHHLESKISDSRARIIVGKMPKVYCDSSQILRLFQNLIDNAIKFKAANREPEVYISVEEKQNTYEFAVKDNGIGIESRFYDRIFAIFQRLHSRSEYEGTGVGLAVCKKIVERHGGEIGVESKVDVGSTFWFTLKK